MDVLRKYINGAERGPSLFGKRNRERSIRTHIKWGLFPLLMVGSEVKLMQDITSGHATKETQDELISLGIEPIHWLSYSPGTSGKI